MMVMSGPPSLVGSLAGLMPGPVVTSNHLEISAELCRCVYRRPRNTPTWVELANQVTALVQVSDIPFWASAPEV